MIRELRQKSLLWVVDPAGADAPARISLYETVRELVAERLAASGARDAVEDRHAAHYVERAEAWAAAEYTAAESRSLERRRVEIRAALRESTGTKRAEQLLAMEWLFGQETEVRNRRVELAELYDAARNSRAVRQRYIA